MLTTEYIENFSTFYEEHGEVFLSHYTDCEEHRVDKQTLSIDLDIFQQLIDQGSMNLFKLKEDDTFIGYINVTIITSPLFKTPQATIDFLYILKDFRRKGYAEEAIAEIERTLISEKVYDLNIHLPDKAYSSTMADKLGYAKSSTIYNKYLGE